MEFLINYWAILAATAANMFIGFLWYGPVFGKYWIKLMGFTPESMRAMPLKPWQAILGGVVIAFVMAYVLAHVAQAFGASGLEGALQLAFWMWLGFIATTMSHAFLWEGKPISLFLLNAAAGLVSIVAMSCILVLWPL